MIKELQPRGTPKPGWISDLAKKLGFSTQEIFDMEYDDLLEVTGLVIEGECWEVEE